MPQHNDKPGRDAESSASDWSHLTESPSHIALTWASDSEQGTHGEPVYLRKQDIAYFRQLSGGGTYVAVRNQISRGLEFHTVREETADVHAQLGGTEASGMIEATLSSDDPRGGGLKMVFPLNAAYLVRPSRIKSNESVAYIRSVDENLKFTFRENVDRLFAMAGFARPRTAAEKRSNPRP
ncbi:MAG: hypothetical protein Alpg2KO_09670 [Alphaproteobacteria bacterium]